MRPSPGSGRRDARTRRMARSVKIDFDFRSLFRGRELRTAIAHEGGGAGYGRLDEVVIVRGDGGYLGPDQTEPGFPGDRGSLGIGLLGLGRLLVDSPGPVPAPPGYQQPGRLQMGHERGGTGSEHEDKDTAEYAEDGTPDSIR